MFKGVPQLSQFLYNCEHSIHLTYIRGNFELNQRILCSDKSRFSNFKFTFFQLEKTESQIFHIKSETKCPLLLDCYFSFLVFNSTIDVQRSAPVTPNIDLPGGRVSPKSRIQLGTINEIVCPIDRDRGFVFLCFNPQFLVDINNYYRQQCQ